jgi:serine protease
MVVAATVTPAVNAIEPNKSEAGIITFTPAENSDQLPTDDLNEPNKSDVGTYTFSPAEYFNASLKDNLSSTGELLIDINSTKTSVNMPVYREVVIVYFKEMPVSMDEFATAYDITPIFVKGDIRMAAFETDPVMIGGVVSEKTTRAIEKISKDPLVEAVKRDTYLFVDPKTEIKTMSSVKYPKDYEGNDYVPNQVTVGFWRLPPSIEEFGEKYGGKPINVTEAYLRLQTVIYETDDMDGFIDRASKDPYVSFIELNPYFHLASIPNGGPE